MTNPTFVLDSGAAARLHAAPLPHTRLLYQPLDGGGVRIVDPPAGCKGVMGNLLIAAGGTFFCIAWGVAARRAWDDPEASSMAVRLCVLALAVVLTAGLLIEAILRACLPLVIEVDHGELRIQQPTLAGRHLAWPASRVRGARSGLLARSVATGHEVTSLVIVPRGAMGVRLLKNREVEEVRWVARQIMLALAASSGSAGVPPSR